MNGGGWLLRSCVQRCAPGAMPEILGPSEKVGLLRLPFAGVWGEWDGRTTRGGAVGVGLPIRSRQDPLPLGVIRSPEMRRSRITLAGNIDLIAATHDELRIDPAFVFHIAQGDGAADAVAVGGRGRVADHDAVAKQRLAAPQDRLGILQNEADQLPPQSRLLLLPQRLAADEGD